MNKDYLIKTGLSEEQVSIYGILLENGELSARKIHQKSPFKRGLVYKILEQLVSLGLIEKKDGVNQVATFLPSHPIKLRDLAEKKEQEAKNAQIALESVLPSLISSFNLVSGQPGISFFEGVEGLSKIYDDILLTGKDILLFRSVYDHDNKELENLVHKQIKRQVAKKIHTLLLAPSRPEDRPDRTAEILKNDEENLRKRKIVPRDQFVLDAQIIIYGNKVAITSLKNKMVSTLIENEEISDTFRTIFQLIWSKSK